jgi:hypothetical protein
MKMSEPRIWAVGGRNKRIDRGVGTRHPLPATHRMASLRTAPSHCLEFSFFRLCHAQRTSEIGSFQTKSEPASLPFYGPVLLHELTFRSLRSS